MYFVAVCPHFDFGFSVEAISEVKSHQLGHALPRQEIGWDEHFQNHLFVLRAIPDYYLVFGHPTSLNLPGEPPGTSQLKYFP